MIDRSREFFLFIAFVSLRAKNSLATAADLKNDVMPAFSREVWINRAERIVSRLRTMFLECGAAAPLFIGVPADARDDSHGCSPRESAAAAAHSKTQAFRETNPADGRVR